MIQPDYRNPYETVWLNKNTWHPNQTFTVRGLKFVQMGKMVQVVMMVKIATVDIVELVFAPVGIMVKHVMGITIARPKNALLVFARDLVRDPFV